MKTKTIIFIVVVAALTMFPSVSSAYVEKSGVIGTETWVGGETYYISSAVHVQFGTLTIEPGAIIKFNDLGSINNIWVEYGGTVIAQGTPDNYIYFTSINDDSIGEVIPGSSGNPARLDYGDGLFILGHASPNTIVEYCVMKYGGRGIVVVGLHMNNPIRHNIIQHQAACVMFYDDAGGEVFNNLCVNSQYGVAGRNAEVVLGNNTLQGETNGINFWHGYWVPNPNVLTIYDNLFSGFQTAIIKRQTGATIIVSDYNAYYNNAVDVSGFTKGPNSIDLLENPYVGIDLNAWHIDQNSPVVDGGSQSAVSAGLDAHTTSLDSTPDAGIVDIGYHYPISATQPPTADADSDGIEDLIDGEFVGGVFIDESSVFSDYFTDQHLGGTSYGQFLRRVVGLVVTITDALNPYGFLAAATGGPGTAKVKACGIPIKLTSEDKSVILCPASLNLQVLVGPVEIELSEEAIVTVPTGATVTVTEIWEGLFEIENSSPEGTPPVLIVIGDEITELYPGEIIDVCSTPPTITPPAPTTLECNSQGGIPASDPQVQYWLDSATAYSPCGDVTITDDAPGFFPVGTTTVTFNASDEFGNTATGTSTVTVDDTMPPELEVPADMMVECAGPDGTPVVIGMASAPDACCEDVEIINDAPAIFPLGDTTVTWTTTDCNGNNTSGAQIVTVVDTIPPTLILPNDVTVECAAVDGTSVDIGMATASDVCCGEVTITNNAPSLFPLGETTITYTATDCNGNMVFLPQTITVVDTTPPEIFVDVEPDYLWPPNHLMVDITAEVQASDVCSVPAVVLETILSSEPDDAPGIGDGETVNDIQDAEYGTPDFNFKLRAERAGTGDGRIYTVTYSAIDPSNNATPASAIVFVPHSMNPRVQPEAAGQSEEGTQDFSFSGSSDTDVPVSPRGEALGVRDPEERRQRRSASQDARRPVSSERTGAREPRDSDKPDSRAKLVSARIARHLNALADKATSETARRDSVHALLNALGESHELETRLQILRGLVGKTDDSMRPLLAEHLEVIRDEARSLGRDDLAQQAELLLKRVEQSED